MIFIFFKIQIQKSIIVHLSTLLFLPCLDPISPQTIKTACSFHHSNKLRNPALKDILTQPVEDKEKNEIFTISQSIETGSKLP